MSGRGFSFGAGLYSGFFTVRFVLAGPTDSEESTALLFLGTDFLGSSDALLSGFEPDFLCLWLLEFKSVVSASFFLFGVALLLDDHYSTKSTCSQPTSVMCYVIVSRST